jgi:signal peptide peptidase SppA
VRLHGIIGSDPLGRGLTMAATAATLENAFTANGVKAVGLMINSPGGSPVQSSYIHDRIRSLAKENGVRVFTFAEDVAASGGYMLLISGDETFAHAHSIVGSIGVVAAGFGFDKMIEKIGVDRRVYTAGTQKAMLDPFQPERADDVEHLKKLQAEVHKGFVAMVKERRRAKLNGSDDALFNGAFWTGATAKELGLIDGLGDVRSVMRERYGEDVELKVFAPRSGLRLFGRSPPSVAIDPAALIASLEERAQWSRFGL